MNVIDLSMPIESGHIRWPVERGKRGDFERGDVFEVSWLKTTCHGFTHVDAPSHMVPDGKTLSDLSLDNVVGPASIVDISGIAPEQVIDAELLENCVDGSLQGRIVLLRTCWYQQRDYKTAAYWQDAPWLAADACDWLLKQSPTAVAFDFPQDWTIRLLLDGEMRPVEEHVSHHILLRNNVTLIEYLINTHKISGSSTFLCAQPISLPGADGAPARVVAIENFPG